MFIEHSAQFANRHAVSSGYRELTDKGREAWIEHHAGEFPVWLAPVQAKVLPIADRHTDYAERVAGELGAAGIRTAVDARSESVGRKIRDAELAKVPYMLVIGEKEQNAGTVAVRARAEGDLGAMPLAEFVTRLDREVKEKRLQA